MTRILIVSNYGWTVFNFRKRLIEGLQRAGHEVFVQTQFDGYETRLGLDSEHVLPLDIDRKGVNPIRDLRTLRSIHSAIRATSPSLCLYFTIKPVVYGGIVATLMHVPYISNVTGLGTAFLGRRWVQKVAEVLLKLGFSGVKLVFFQNRDDHSHIVGNGLLSPDRAQILPGSGVDLERFAFAPYPSNAAPVFLLAARLIWGKGVGEFVEAARAIKNENPATRFQLLGPTDVVNPAAIPKERIDSWAKAGTVEYLGNTDDVVPYLRAADCVVLPSTYREGVPRILLEASAIGRPVITTNAPGCRDVVEDGQTGLLCEPGNAKDLAEKMRTILRTPIPLRAEMGRRARGRMVRMFDENLVIQSYIREVALAL